MRRKEREMRRLQTFPPLPRNGEIRQSWPTKTELPDRPRGLLVIGCRSAHGFEERDSSQAPTRLPNEATRL
jgi:hypothetical protein